MGELGADLVRPSGDQLAFNQRQSTVHCHDFIIGAAAFGAGLRRIGHKHAVFLGILEQVAGEAALFRLGCSLYKRLQ